MLETIKKVRYWLIKKIVGSDVVVLNCSIEGTIRIEKGQHGFLFNNKIFGKYIANDQRNVLEEIARLQQKGKEEPWNVDW